MKRFLLIAALLLGVAALLFLAVRSPDHEEGQPALAAFLEGRYEEALSILDESPLSPAESKLYRAYILREEGQLALAESLLEGALESCEAEETGAVEREIRLNLALNALIEGEEREALFWLSSVDPSWKEEPSLVDLQAAAAYLRREFGEADRLLQLEKPLSSAPSWIETPLKRLFGGRWRDLALTRCAIERGELIEARERLDGLVGKSLTLREQAERSLLMALSYAKQAERSQNESAFTYYLLAYTHLKESALFAAEQSTFAEQWLAAATDYFKRGKWEEWATLCRHLEEWEAVSAIEGMGGAIANALFDEGLQGQWKEAMKEAHQIDFVLPRGAISKATGRQLEERLYRAIQERSPVELVELWRLTQLFSEKPAEVERKAAALAMSRALDEPGRDSAELRETRRMLEFWKRLPHTAQERVAFAQKLLTRGYYLWHEAGAAEKGAALIELAYTLPKEEEREPLRTELDLALRSVFAMAKEENQIGRMRAIDSLASHFSIDIVGSEERGSIGNLLADADYLYHAGRYVDAGELASWILRLEPGHLAATRLLGLSQFEQKRYEEALKTLSPLKEQSRAVQEAIGISQLHVGEVTSGRKLLWELSAVEPLADRVYLEIAASLIRGGENREALEWLHFVDERVEAAQFLRLYAKLQLGSYEGATRDYEQLSAEYRLRPDLNALLAKFYLAHGQLNRARSSVDLALSHREAEGLFPAPDPRILSARIAIALQSDRAAALAALSQIDPPTFESRQLEGELAESRGEFIPAFTRYREAAQLATSQEERRVVEKQAERMGTAAGLLEDVAAIYLAGGAGPTGELARAAIYSRVGRWDLALREYEAIGSRRPFSPEEEVGRIQALVEMNRWPEAERLAKRGVEADLFSPELQLRLRVALRTEEEGETRPREREIAYLPLSKARAQWQESPSLITLRLAYARAALLSDEVEELEELVDLMSELQEEASFVPEFHLLLGRLYLLRGEEQRAHSAFLRTVELHPGFAAAQRELAESWRRFGEEERAAAALELANRYATGT